MQNFKKKKKNNNKEQIPRKTGYIHTDVRTYGSTDEHDFIRTLLRGAQKSFYLPKN